MSGAETPDESVLFELILATADERFIEVTRLYRRQAGFVHGVRWRETEGVGEVVAVFPELQ
jgi:hypothetical protein